MTTMLQTYDANTKKFTDVWATKTTKQIKKEILSWQKYMDKHSSAYAWHGKDITAPGQLADGDKIRILKEILAERNEV